MDLHNFDVDDLYFETPPEEDVTWLINQAADAYAEGEAEPYLLRAFSQAPDNLMVLVAMYRFYYYQHRYPDAYEIAQRAISVSGRLFGYEGDWRHMNMNVLAYGMKRSFGMVRFYLLALKGAGYLQLRMGGIDQGIEYFEKVLELDSANRMGAASLLEIANNKKGLYSIKHRMTA